LEKAVSSTVNRPPLPHKSYSRVSQVMDVPNLIEIQLDSFQWFQEEGIKQLLEEISPIKDFTGNKLELSFVGYEFREPRYSELECAQRDQNFSMPLYVKARLLVKGTGEIKEPFDLFFGDIPMMTAQGTFITSGTERIIVSQLLRSPGVYFTTEEEPVGCCAPPTLFPAGEPGWISKPQAAM
jgi:DNA-directed RNA polymerase subunit beta